jgi:hypothetical protein
LFSERQLDGVFTARGESGRVVGLRQRVACLDCVRARGTIVICALDRIVRSMVIAVQTTPFAGGLLAAT